MHVFNFANNQGYAIMAGDRRVPSPMCFVEKGNFTEKDSNTSLDGFIMSELMGMYQAARVLPDSVKYDISSLPDYYLTTKAPFHPVDTVFIDGKYYVYYNWEQDATPYGTIIETQWSQDSPFNDYCPTYFDSTSMSYKHYHVGCTPTAVGQVMAFWKADSSEVIHEWLLSI